MSFYPLSRCPHWFPPTRIIALGFLVSFAASLRGATDSKPSRPQVETSEQSSQASAESEAIKHLIAKYAKSIDEADTTLASQIWLNSPDVSFIHPLGHEHGLEQIEQNVYRRLMGETFSERKLTPHDISVHVYKGAAWAEFYWDFNAKFGKDGSPVTTHGRETQIYWKTKDGWRLVHVHYSGMPVGDQRKGL